MKASKRGDFKKAIEFYQLALKIAKDTGNKDGEGSIGESLLTSLFTFFLISIRLNSQKPCRTYELNEKVERAD